jgi:hypothetical protein
MLFYLFLSWIFFSASGWSGPWKQNLNFTLSDTDFNQIDDFHKELSYLEKRETEDFLLGRPGDRDSIGNSVYDDGGVLKCRKNTRNVAQASIQFVYGTPDVSFERFIPLAPHGGGRFFYSTPDRDRDYEDDVLNRVSGKSVWNVRSQYYPSRVQNLRYFNAYHGHPHAEDYIFHELSLNSERITQEFSSSIEDEHRIKAAILHVNNRFDMCGNCAYSLDWELRGNNGFANAVIQAANALDVADPNIFFSALVSSRQDYSGVWGPSRRSLPEVISGPRTRNHRFADFTDRLRLDHTTDGIFFQWTVPSFFEVPALV